MLLTISPMTHRPLFLFSTLAATALTTLSFSTPADACGGLFCDSSNPVNQAAERIVFAKNDDGTVTAAIEVLYEGSATEFAWVLPVPAGKIAVGVSSKLALDRLDAQSNPRYQLTQESDDCGFDTDSATSGGDPRAPGSTPPGLGGVLVVAEGNAGPYLWSQITVSPDLPKPADAAIMWLKENGFDVTRLGSDLLGEYLEEGMNLVAFKLQKGKTTGSIRPVLITYPSDRPMIPIRPTAVAANADMGIKVWVLGDSRAIPENFRHLELNEALIDWFTPTSNYNDVVIAAANEAGGQGFVTEQSGPAAAFAETLYGEFEAQLWNELRTGRFESLQAFFERARDSFAQYDGFNDVMLDPKFVPLREGATNETFLRCISCYFESNVAVRNAAYPETDYPGKTDPIHTTDIDAFLARFYTLVIEPLELTRALFEDHSSVTRFYTTLSPDEMKVDPLFNFNPELPDVDNLHVARQILACEDDRWRVVLPQGVIIHGEGFGTWPVTLNQDLPVNLRVTQLSTKGDGKVIQDNRETFAAMLTDLKLGETASQPMNPSMGNDEDPGDGKQGVTT
ncbi:MAG: hypothetical protein RJA70_2377, partial [Pseudomonadota bacterium]